MNQPNTLENLIKAIHSKSDPEKARFLQRFFKTAPGQYAAGDLFLGLTVPTQRQIARQFRDLPLQNLKTLIRSPYHEERLISLLILIEQFDTAGRHKPRPAPRGTKSHPSPSPLAFKNKKFLNLNSEFLLLNSLSGGRGEGDDDFTLAPGTQSLLQPPQQKLVQFYLDSTEFINNWDLVDLSAPRILGKYLSSNSNSTNSPITRQILHKLVKSKNLWERRISIISTLFFVKNNDFDDALKLSENLLYDKHDLIHKAVGWVLREIGKKNLNVLDAFLQKHYHQMPRTMLRYAIEKHPEEIRQKYLKGQI